MPNIKAMEEYNLTHREKRVILDEVKGLKVSHKINFFYRFIGIQFFQKRSRMFVIYAFSPFQGNARSLRPPIGYNEDFKKGPKCSYLDLLRCGGKTHR